MKLPAQGIFAAGGDIIVVNSIARWAVSINDRADGALGDSVIGFQTGRRGRGRIDPSGLCQVLDPLRRRVTI